MLIPKEFVDAMRKANIQDYRYFDSVGSTNQVALNWLEESAPDFSVVFADHQSSGRGRFNRHWVTQPKSAIALSIILRPTIEEQKKLSLFSPLAGIALLDVLEQTYEINAEIKWPNDVLIKREKTSGILTESNWEGNRVLGIVVGIGINILSSSIPPQEKLNFRATYLQAHTKNVIDRYELLVQLLQSFSNWRPLIHTQDFLNYWSKQLAFQGEKVYIKQKDGNIQLTGTLLGINENGDLKIESEDNLLHTITAGDVHLRPVGSEK